jgi:hypothetical protein
MPAMPHLRHRSSRVNVMRSLLGVAALFAAVLPARAALGDRIVVTEGEFRAGADHIWINGANTPWHSWNDFGGSFDPAWWEAHFQSLHTAGINATRVWITCNGEVGIEIDSAGQVRGATPAHWNDLDHLFEIARRHRIYVMATLLSFDHFKDSHPGHKRWREWLSRDDTIDSYLEHYLVPFVRRYRDNPYLWSIDLMNEPDWVHENANNGRFPWSRLQSYFARGARTIHANSAILVTVGIAMPKYNSDSTKGAVGNMIGDPALRAQLNDPAARVDFYSLHYYDWIGKFWGNLVYQNPADAGLPTDKPSLFGEMPANGTTGHTTAEDYESAYRRGWQGAMGWTSNGVDDNGSLRQLAPATEAFRDHHQALVFPGEQ